MVTVLSSGAARLMNSVDGCIHAYPDVLSVGVARHRHPMILHRTSPVLPIGSQVNRPV